MADSFINSAPAVGGTVPLKLYDLGDGHFSLHPPPRITELVTTAGAALDIAGDEAADVVGASATPRAVALYNRGGAGAGDYVTFDVDADATGADTERRLYVGQRLVLANGGRFTARVSVFAPNPTTIEWETWA